MKYVYFILFTLITFIAQAQFIEFNFDNATVSGNTMTQDVFIGSDGYRLTATHGSNSNAALFNNGTGDLFLQGTGGSRPEQNWTLSLIKNGSAENFEFISVDYLNNGGATHTFIIGDSSNNAISAQTNIPPGNAGTLTVANQANATNLSSCLIFGFSFSATVETYFNNLRIRPVSLLSSEGQIKEELITFQENNNLVMSHSLLENAKISIYSLTGQEVLTETAKSNQHQVDMMNLSSGMYIVRVSKGDFNETIKLIR